jgi:hypothetical protein
MTFEVFKVVMIQVKVFWVLTLCSVAEGDQHFRGPCCLPLQVEVAGLGKSSIDIGPDWRGAAGASSQ